MQLNKVPSKLWFLSYDADNSVALISTNRDEVRDRKRMLVAKHPSKKYSIWSRSVVLGPVERE